jgi:SPP1 gp7 family putative phage head morphogenesis protein
VAAQVTPLKEGTFPEKPLDKVTSYDRLSSYLAGNFPRYNPDELVQRKGLAVYARMMCDDQVKPVSQFKRDAILGRGWQFKFQEDSKLSEDEQKKRTRVFTEIVRQSKGSFQDSLNGILTGREYGFSLTEKVYTATSVDGQDYIGLNRLLTRDPCTFQFFTNEYGLLDRAVQKVTGKKDLELDLSSFIHYVHAPEWDYVWGRSDLRAAYRAWYIKEQVQNLWLMYLERFQGGFIVAKRVSDDAPSFGTQDYLELQRALNSVKSLSSMILPKGVEVDVEFPASTDAFEKAVQAADIAIARSMLVPNLLGLTHAGQTGSYSQSQTQLEAFFWTLNADADRISAVLNEQLFRDLGDQNWSDGEYPEFCFEPASMEHAKWVVETWVNLTKSNSVIPTELDEQYLRKLLDMPPRKPDAEPLVNPLEEKKLEVQQQMNDQNLQAKQDAQANAAATFEALRSQLEQVKGELIRLAAKPDQPVIVRSAGDVTLRSPETPADPHIHLHGELVGCTPAQFSRAVQRVAFTVIEKRTDDAAAHNVERIAGLMASAVKRALGNDDHLKQLTDEDPSDIAAIALNAADIGKVKKAAQDALVQGWRLGQDTALNEMERAKGMRFKRVHLKNLRDQATAYFEANGFRMAGNLADGAKAIIQQELAQAVKFGTPTTETRAKIWERLVEKGFTSQSSVQGVEDDQDVLGLLDNVWLESEAAAIPYLNTLVRTNVFEALNEARFAEFTDPELGDFVQALQYAAVLDSSTTEICQELGTGGEDGDGVIYSVNSDLWNTYRPPNHYNCRSVLVPITVIDGWSGQESDPPSVEPQDGFK